MTKKIAATAAVAFAAGGVLPPAPDPFTILVFGIAAAILSAAPLLILSRFDFLRSASKHVHTLVCILVFLAAVLSVACFTLAGKVAHGTA